tara:strand:+ start:5574 stop:5738 length:165 start_codon:yes stop_codon:yes gene_type:complete
MAIISFIALGFTGIAVLKIKKALDNRKKSKQKTLKDADKETSTISQLLKLPDDV